MRVLAVTQVELTDGPGAVRHVVPVIEGLGRLGHDVTLIAPGDLSVRGVRHVRPHIWKKAGFRLEMLLATLATRQVLGSRPDVAYVRLGGSTSWTTEVLSRLGVPIVVELNGDPLDEQRRAGASAMKISAMQRLLSRAVSVSEVVVGPLEATLETARRSFGAKNVALVENGVELEAAQPGERDDARATLGLPDGDVVGMIGTITNQQRLDLLEAVWPIENATLLVVGGGTENARIEALAARGRVTFLGAQPHARAVLAVRASSVCVNLRDDWLGMRSLEYAAVGRRQVVFETDGTERVSRLYPKLSATHVVTSRTPEGLRGAIDAALAAERTLGPLPRAAIEAARTTLGWEHTARGLSDVFEGVTARRCSSSERTPSE